jgi:hypothetical protein
MPKERLRVDGARHSQSMHLPLDSGDALQRGIPV